jgi:hypothetical protein
MHAKSERIATSLLGVLAIVSTLSAALGLCNPATCQRSSLGFTPKTAGQTTKCTKHTKNDRLTRAEGRKLRVEGRKNVCRRRATQSHAGAKVEGRMKNAEGLCKAMILLKNPHFPTEIWPFLPK